MADVTKTPLWTMLVDPKRPSASMLLYKGEPVGLVQEMKVGVEIVPGAKSQVIQTILSLRIIAQDLALGTFDSEVAETAAKQPVQGELPLGDKKP